MLRCFRGGPSSSIIVRLCLPVPGQMLFCLALQLPGLCFIYIYILSSTPLLALLSSPLLMIHTFSTKNSLELLPKNPPCDTTSFAKLSILFNHVPIPRRRTTLSTAGPKTETSLSDPATFPE